MSDLRPCPFCGGEAAIQEHPRHHYRVCCRGGCSGRTGSYAPQHAAVTVWNTRADARIEELEATQARQPVATAPKDGIGNILNSEIDDRFDVIRRCLDRAQTSAEAQANGGMIDHIQHIRNETNLLKDALLPPSAKQEQSK